MAPQTTTRMTYDEFMALPEDSQHYELIEGELIVNPSPVPRHQRILRKIFFALCAYFETSGGGEAFCAPLDVVEVPPERPPKSKPATILGYAKIL